MAAFYPHAAARHIEATTVNCVSTHFKQQQNKHIFKDLVPVLCVSQFAAFLRGNINTRFQDSINMISRIQLEAYRDFSQTWLWYNGVGPLSLTQQLPVCKIRDHLNVFILTIELHSVGPPLHHFKLCETNLECVLFVV